MGSKPKLCPHGILGKMKCKLCQKLSHNKYWIKNGREVGKNNKLCPHGIIGKSKCKICEKEYNDNRRRKLGARVGIGSGWQLQTCQHGILGKSKCKLCHKEIQDRHYRKIGMNVGSQKWDHKKQTCQHNISPKRNCELCKKLYYQNRKEEYKQYSINYRLIHKEELSKKHKLYYLENKDEIDARINKWNNEHKEQKSERDKKYRETHKDKLVMGRKKWYYEKGGKEKNIEFKRNNPEIVKKWRSDYYETHKEEEFAKKEIWIKNNPEKWKEMCRKRTTKRLRELDWNPINDLFIGSDGHHIDNEIVIYIPTWLHESLYPHSVTKNLNMQLVNDCVFQYLECTNQVEWIN